MSNEIQKLQKSDSPGLDLFNPDTFATLQRVAKMFASSELVPDMYKITDKNSPEKAMGNCIVAINIAQRMNADILMVMQNMVPIYGKPTWSSSFLIARVNSMGRFESLQFRFENLGKVGKVKYTEFKTEWTNGKKKSTPVTREFDGTKIDNWQCIAWTKKKGSSDILESTPVDVVMAIQEGWYTKNGSKWVTMTKQMLQYRSASFWTKVYAPEATMGMPTTDEMHDTIDISYEEVNEETKAKEDISKRGNSQQIDPNNIPEGGEAKAPGNPEPEPEQKAEEKKEAPRGGGGNENLQMQSPSF